MQKGSIKKGVTPSFEFWEGFALPERHRIPNVIQIGPYCPGWVTRLSAGTRILICRACSACFRS